MPGKLNWGIIGTGFIEEKFAEQLPEAPGAGVAAVGSCSLEPAGRLRRRPGPVSTLNCLKIETCPGAR